MAIPEVFQSVCKRNGWSIEGNQARVSLEGGREQKVFIETFVHEDHHMVRAYSIVGDSGSLSQTRLEAALSINFSLAHGALAIREGELVMTDTFLIQDADASEVEASIRHISKTADRYEKLIYGTDKN